ncbi:hypothetical protein [Streptococcus mitis]|jgi:hypothetical protein|uniref:Uncharacterized protein n=1 Tax=Streptococcus mitis TaxID=28037 RepID=A0A081R1H2_STRMT|nr:hypothetical protein [Streptococcus mitis]KEQ49045.1 hypothetical protein SK608_0039 [Streptococcus mitis]
MGTILFLIIVVLLGFFFYLQDTKKHKKMFVYNLLYTLFQEKYIIKDMICEYEEKYPALTKVVLSFVETQSDVSTIVKNSKKVEGSLKQQLDKEIDEIIASKKNPELLRVMHWYFLACITISTLRTHDNIDIIKKDSIDFEEGAISKSDLKGNYCFA